MNVIVSNNAIDYEGFIKVSKLKDTLSLEGNIDYLVIHKSNDSEDEKVRILTTLKDRVGKMVYIRSADCIDKTIQMIVLGSDGKYIDDEFFLESATDLNGLVGNLHEVSTITTMGGVNVVGDFFNKYISEDAPDFSKEYLQLVKSAVSGMVLDYNKRGLEILQLAETATEIFTSSATLIARVEGERESLKNSIDKLKSIKENIVPTAKPSDSSQNIIFFPKISYIKNVTVTRIKEIGNFPYLTSFMLGYRLYLEQLKYSKAKLVFIMPVGTQIEEEYKEFDWVTQKSSNSIDCYEKDVIFTNFPTQSVLERLIEEGGYDEFIIVDRLKSSNQHVLNCRGSSIKYAVSSEKFLNSSTMKLSDCIFRKSVSGSLFSLSNSTEYPEKVSQRENFYVREYGFAYNMLNTSGKGGAK